jgi:phosphate/sulfate permease
MNKAIIIIFFFSFLLSGCVSKEDQILDFAGIVFIIFALIVIVQLSFDKILSSSVYKKLNEFSAPVRRIVPPIAVLLGIIISLYGIFSHGLNQISILIGVITILFGWFMKQYNREDFDDKQRSRYAKLMMLCVTFGISLYFLMTIAKDVLKF